MKTNQSHAIAQVFQTITGADWARSIAASRARPNAVAAKIRAAIAAIKTKS